MEMQYHLQCLLKPHARLSLPIFAQNTLVWEFSVLIILNTGYTKVWRKKNVDFSENMVRNDKLWKQPTVDPESSLVMQQ